MKLIKTPTILGLVLVLVGGFGCASAQKGNVMRAQFAAEKGHYQYALNRLNEAEHLIEPAPQVKAEIVYLKGVCYQGLGRNAVRGDRFNTLLNNSQIPSLDIRRGKAVQRGQEIE